MDAALAAVPPAVALALLLARVPAMWAALLSLVSAALVTALAFPTPLPTIAAAEWRALPTCAEVALILLGGVLLNQLMSAAGANQRLADWLAGACRSQPRAVVLVVLGVTPFAESVTGFGIGVVVAVPLLRRLGLPPLCAAVVGLLGLVTVPWGALGPGTLVAAQLTGVGFQQLGVLSALFSLPVFLLVGAAALGIAVGLRPALSALPELLTAATTLGVTVWAVNATIGVPLAGALGSFVTVLVNLLLAALREGRRPPAGPDVRHALAPYLVLLGCLLGAQMVVAAVPGPAGPWAAVATSPALWLLFTCALVPRMFAMTAPSARTAFAAAVRRWWPVAVATVAFIALGVLLTVTRMSDTLAAAAAGLGTGYLLLAPFVGALGGFLTGSNAGANAMFASGQAATAQAIGVSTAGLVAVQNVSASLATMASIPRVALATGVAQDSVPEPLRTPPNAGQAGRDAEHTAPIAPGRVLPPVLAVDLCVLAVLGVIAMVVL
ncbi:L-lactate permease [Qaidamihabitans albus]|uniref:L-lactate permease n=1 Tax=Qaidamihabitans albus TaxID=2795733 RepID=UPI0018F1BC0C|nr:L-lactate permease [Qaidamihabitans albus]